MSKRRKEIRCPKCNSVIGEPIKTWQLISPFPDKKGRITITIMGVFECPECGYRWRGVYSKIKVGGSSVEVGGREIEEEERRPPKIIELDLSDLDEEDFED